MPLGALVFCFLKNLLWLKLNILSSVYLEINFPAEPVYAKISLKHVLELCVLTNSSVNADYNQANYSSFLTLFV